MSAQSILEPGDVLGDDFRIEAFLGSGGMGAVYRARQLTTGAARAIKVLLPKYANDGAHRARFEREARACGAIRSDHVVQVIRFGIDEARSLPWIAMELLEGEPLQAFAARHAPLGARRCADVLLQLFHGVAAAHEAGVVHRDLKPANVHVSQARRAAARLTVKVLDFGIAKDVSDGSTSTEPYGSAPWMAPEQHTGVVAPSVDVWALGLITFWLLTGGMYFAAGTRRDGAALPPASARAEELGAPALGPDFDVWFARSVEMDPSRRFRHAGESWAALAPVVARLAAAGHDDEAAASPPVSHDSETEAGSSSHSRAASGASETRVLTPLRRGWIVAGCFVLAVAGIRGCAGAGSAGRPSPATHLR